MNNRDTDFFRPLWRRVVVTTVVVAWFCYESFVAMPKDQLWITITAVALAYCVWNFFLRFPKDPPPGDGNRSKSADSGDGPPKS